MSAPDPTLWHLFQLFPLYGDLVHLAPRELTFLTQWIHATSSNPNTNCYDFDTCPNALKTRMIRHTGSLLSHFLAFLFQRLYNMFAPSSHIEPYFSPGHFYIESFYVQMFFLFILSSQILIFCNFLPFQALLLFFLAFVLHFLCVFSII